MWYGVHDVVFSNAETRSTLAVAWLVGGISAPPLSMDCFLTDNIVVMRI